MISDQRIFNNPWRVFFVVKMLQSQFTHYWSVFLRELKIRLDCWQKGSNESNEMHRCIPVLRWWHRRYVGLHGVFFTHSGNDRGCEGVLCVVGMRCSWMYWMYRTVNQRRARIHFNSQVYVEDLGPPAMNGIRTHNFSIDNVCLTNRTPSLLANLKALNFRQWNQSGFSNPLQIISSYEHFKIQYVLTIFLVWNATSQQLVS